MTYADPPFHTETVASATRAGQRVGTWRLDLATGRVVCSETARALLGVPPDLPIDLDLVLSGIDDADRGPTAQAIRRCIAGGDHCDVQFRVRRQPDVTHWVHMLGARTSDAAGTPYSLDGFVLDIDEDKRLQEALKLRENHFRSILDTAPEAMIVIDGQGIIQFFSRAAERQFGYPAAEVVGTNIRVLMPEPDRGNHDGYLARYLATGDRHIIGIGRVVNARRRDGELFPMHLTIGEMQSEGRPYFTGFMRDLTEQQQTQTRLHELQSELVHVSRLSAMGEMASALAHELNQPLSAISNYMKGSRRLLAGSIDPNAARIEAALDRASEQAIRAGQIIRRLRNFVLREASEKRVESLARLVEEAAALGLSGAGEQGVALRFHLDPACDTVHADRVQVQQILVNLFRNALEAMSQTERRELTVSSARSADDMVEIAVADTGHGFGADMPVKLFQPFYTTKESGMGIGLSISRTIVETHGGRMWAGCNDAGGATFFFTLPAATIRETVHVAE
jgi:two-component system sensor kinase FixL